MGHIPAYYKKEIEKQRMHVDWATNSRRYGPNRGPRGLRMIFARILGSILAYGPGPVKSLARFYDVTDGD